MGDRDPVKTVACRPIYLMMGRDDLWRERGGLFKIGNR
jgi:hypothetical protein